MGSQEQQQQQFSLRWNNHQMNLLNVFDQLLQDESFVDVTLACDGLSLKAHKVVLSACSPYFQKLLLDNPCPHPIVILDNVHYADLKALIDFMYKGEVSVFQDQLSTILKTADTLKIKGLSEVTTLSSGEVVLDPKGPSSSSSSADLLHPPPNPPNPHSSSSSPLSKRRRLHRSRRKSGTGTGGGGGGSGSEEEDASEGSLGSSDPKSNAQNDENGLILRGDDVSSQRHHRSTPSSSSSFAKPDQQTNVDCRPEPRVHEGFSQDNVEPQHSTLEAAVNFLVIGGGGGAPPPPPGPPNPSSSSSSSSASSFTNGQQQQQTATSSSTTSSSSSSHHHHHHHHNQQQQQQQQQGHGQYHTATLPLQSSSILSQQQSSHLTQDVTLDNGNKNAVVYNTSSTSSSSSVSSLATVDANRAIVSLEVSSKDCNELSDGRGGGGCQWTSGDVSHALEVIRHGLPRSTTLSRTPPSLYGIPNAMFWQRPKREPVESSKRDYSMATTGWTEDVLNQALEAVRTGRMSITKAAVTFGIPNTTLWQRSRREGIDTSRNGGPFHQSNYTESNLAQALEAVRSGRMSVNKASATYGIPSTTLWSRAKRYGIETSRRGGAYENERDEVMWHALQAVKTGVISMTQASIKYNVPYTTLWKHFKKWEMIGGPLTLPLSSMSAAHTHSTQITTSALGMVGHHVTSGSLHSHQIDGIVGEQTAASSLTT